MQTLPVNEIAISARKTRLVIGGLALAVNIVLVVALALSLRPTISTQGAHEMFARVIEDTAPITLPTSVQPQLRNPTVEIAPPPEVQIANAHPANAISVQLASLVLAPRPDPAHYNQQPILPPIYSADHAGTSLTAKIYVSKDGLIADASILKSCGDSNLDAIAVAYIKEHWRFLPAAVSGVAIDDWTSVGVTFRAAAG